MNTQHTPGPWGSSGTAGHETHGQFAVYHLGTGKDIAIVYDGKSNARLIAAAPELIHACELAYAELGKMGCDCENMPTHCPVCALKAAIAKARGL